MLQGLIEQYKTLLPQHKQARKQYEVVGEQLNRLQPKLERAVCKALNDKFKTIAGKLQVQIISNKLRIWVERHAQKDATHDFKIGKMWVSVCYPLDDFVGGYQAIRYAPYSKIEPLLKKWLKAQNIDKCFKDGYY